MHKQFQLYMSIRDISKQYIKVMANIRPQSHPTVSDDVAEDGTCLP